MRPQPLPDEQQDEGDDRIHIRQDEYLGADREEPTRDGASILRSCFRRDASIVGSAVRGR
jgi:hypothetical protein